MATVALTVGTSVALRFTPLGDKPAYELFDMIVMRVESDSIVVVDPMGPLTLLRTSKGLEADNCIVTVFDAA